MKNIDELRLLIGVENRLNIEWIWSLCLAFVFQNSDGINDHDCTLKRIRG